MLQMEGLGVGKTVFEAIKEDAPLPQTTLHSLLSMLFMNSWPYLLAVNVNLCV